MSQDVLKALNPGKSLDQAGATIVVANVEPGIGSKEQKDRKNGEKVAKLEVDKKGRELRAVAKDGAVLAVYPASIGSRDKPAPSGSHTVRLSLRARPTPTIRSTPSKASRKRFEIKPGANNPVGTTWIDLSIESFGIHGTAEPKKVGKAYSHGCVRLTNWDVH